MVESNRSCLIILFYFRTLALSAAKKLEEENRQRKLEVDRLREERKKNERDKTLQEVSATLKYCLTMMAMS